MVLVIYSIDDCSDKISVSNFDYFVNYGLLNCKWVSAKYPITQIIIFVQNKKSHKLYIVIKCNYDDKTHLLINLFNCSIR